MMTTTTATTTVETSVKTQRIYKFRPGVSEPKFLDKVDMDHQLIIQDLQQQQEEESVVEFRTLDETHLNGLIHTGVWIHVIDSSKASKTGDNHHHRLLLLKRGPQLVSKFLVILRGELVPVWRLEGLGSVYVVELLSGLH